MPTALCQVILSYIGNEELLTIRCVSVNLKSSISNLMEIKLKHYKPRKYEISKMYKQIPNKQRAVSEGNSHKLKEGMKIIRMKIEPEDLSKLMPYPSPAECVVDIFQILYLLLGIDYSSWEKMYSAQKYMKKLLTSRDPGDISDGIILQAEGMLKKIDKTAVEQAWSHGSFVYSWSRNLMALSGISKKVKADKINKIKEEITFLDNWIYVFENIELPHDDEDDDDEDEDEEDEEEDKIKDMD